ncbi:stage II sporulation protein R [Siminovitchia terrae]|uniref:Stage II sporulation protein R n=1 Tax=Siminovitchia terrae TaxID=1914933 RepID=A0A429XBY5_SIMTE|nr:stage II sporulation protein R [Siminovitchia terrae]RST60975.1 stage II sporulation protein R [Siminovitchia terrae]GIN90835.1 stage II sporulation protein R [Siminovitchia terrae]GIN97611.1 stage II sporulation protein R [Siminovitchia terrae]
MRKNSKQKFYQKYIASAYIAILSLAAVMNFYFPDQESSAAENVQVIPEEAIRLRILANSDSEKDQEVKRAVRDAVNKQINEWVEQLTSIEEARHVISSRLPELEKIAKNELIKHGLSYSVSIDFGDVQFPTKLYGQYLYPAGTYEAVLITLGEGKGANWWCVLFPPLCFLDFSNSAAVSQGIEEDVDNAVDIEMEQDESLSYVEDEQTEVPVPAFVGEQEEEVEVKFFLKELFDELL